MSDVHLNLHIVKFFVLTLFNLVLFLLYIHLNSLRDYELTSSCSVFCQYLLELVYLIEKSRWVHVEYTQHYIDQSLYESKKRDLEAHYTWPASINIASKTRL